MHFYNGQAAADRIGISYKTLLRWKDQGKIRPEDEKTSDGQLLISEDQVESLRLEKQHERGMLRQPQKTTPRLGQHETAIDSPEVPLTDTTLNEALKAIGKLQSRCDVQQSHIEELERRIADLETKSYPVIVENVAMPPAPAQTVDYVIPAKVAQISNTQPSTDMLSAKDLAERLGIPFTVLDGYIRRGVRGEMIEYTDVPTARKGYSNRFFTPEQVEKAIALLKKHGKL